MTRTRCTLRQRREQSQAFAQIADRFLVSPALKCALASALPVIDSQLRQSCLSVVMCQQFRLDLGQFGKTVFQQRGDLAVQRADWVGAQSAYEEVRYRDPGNPEVEERLARGLGPVTPDGEVEERFRLVVEGPPNWTSFREFWRMFAGEGAVVVASSYTKVGGVYDTGFRHDPDRPLETLAEYCMGCYTNLNLPSRVDMLARYVEEYDADGLLVNSIKSCNSFSAGQLMMLREVENRTGRPAGFIESDLVDPRYFSAANIKNPAV